MCPSLCLLLSVSTKISSQITRPLWPRYWANCCRAVTRTAHCLASLYSGLIRRRHQPSQHEGSMPSNDLCVWLLVNWDKTMLRFAISRKWESDTWHLWHCEDDKVTYLCRRASLPWPQRAIVLQLITTIWISAATCFASRREKVSTKFRGTQYSEKARSSRMGGLVSKDFPPSTNRDLCG